MPVELHWLRPGWLLALLPLAVLLSVLVRRGRRVRHWEQLVDAPLRGLVLTPGDDVRNGRILVLLGISWLLLVIALASPAWQLATRPVFRIEQPRVLLLDLAESMQAVDVAPSRLARARFEAVDLLRGTDEGQFALIAFGAEPFLIAPLTTDAGTILEQVPPLAPDLLPVSGERRTDLALNLAATLLHRSSATGADIIVITDGVGPSVAAEASAAALAAAGHRVSVLAVAPSPGLDALAAAGGGVVVAARPDDADTAQLLALQGAARVGASGERVNVDQQWRDEGPWLLLLALPLAALAFRRGWVGVLPLALLFTPPMPVQASFWSDLWLRPEQQALRAADGGRLEAALAGLDDPRWRGALRYRAGDYAGALVELAGQRGAEAHYNRGNVLARLGRLDAAVAEYDAVLELDPDHADARHNRDLLLALMSTPKPAPLRSGSDSEDRADDSTTDDGNGNNASGTSADALEASPQVGASGIDEGNSTSAPSSSLEGGSDQQGTGAELTQPGDMGLTGSVGSEAVSSQSAARGLDDSGAARGSAVAEQVVSMADASEGEDPERAAAAAADDYLLRQVPDDPSRLLRERLLLQYLRRHGRLH